MTTIIIEDEDGEHYEEVLATAFPAVRFSVAPDLDGLVDRLAEVADAEVLMTKGASMCPEVLESLPRLRWVQALITGVDRFVPALRGRGEVELTSMRGIHGPQMAETVITQMLVLNRSVARSVLNQAARRWDRWSPVQLAGKTVGVVGLGVSGQQVARLCRCLGMHVIGVSRTSDAAGSCDELHGYDELAEVASRVDFLVLTASYTAETHHLVDAALLARMRPSAYLLNVARGGVVDEEALIDALRARSIAGAALDVFETEPLPSSSALWDLDNVFLTAHLAGRSDRYADQALSVLEHNLRCYLSGDKAAMLNRIPLDS